MVGVVVKQRERHKVYLVAPNFRGRTYIEVSQRSGGNIWFIFRTKDLELLGIDKDKHYWVVFNDGEVGFKIKFRRYKPYWCFWINAQYLPKEIYAIYFEEVMEDVE